MKKSLSSLKMSNNKLKILFVVYNKSMMTII